MESLNPKQLAAVHHPSGPLLVLAGAGSGKTRVVTSRIARLIETGIPPSAILAVTFTNKAAQELKYRIQSATQAHILASTFHSLGARILREWISILGYQPHFVIYDAEDCEKLLKGCLQDLNQSHLLKQARLDISSAKNQQQSPEEMKDPTMAPIYRLYQARLQECNALDFDDLLYLSVRVLQQDANARTSLQQRWITLLIDEYQDTNYTQHCLAKILVAQHKNICAVGDPDQSIYSWRGACYRNILNFERDFPGATIITLDQNYRSTNTILQAANHLIAHNPTRYEKRLWSQNGDGPKIELCLAPTERQEAEFVTKKILAHQQLSLNEVAVLIRTNAQSRSFEDAFLRYCIPYTIVGGVPFYQRREIKDIIAYLRMLISDHDLIAFLRTVNLPKRGLGAATLGKIVDQANTRQEPIFSLCRAIAPSLTPKQKTGLTEYVQLIEDFRAKSATTSLQNLISDLISASRYLSVLQEEPETLADRKENLVALIAKAAEWAEERTQPTLPLFLEELSLHTSMEEQRPVPSVQLMTLHSSKGLEFKTVFLTGLEEELLPHSNAFGSPEALEEERRLCYVGMTRAKQQLLMTAARTRSSWTGPKLMQPSRFLREIPTQFFKATQYLSH